MSSCFELQHQQLAVRISTPASFPSRPTPFETSPPTTYALTSTLPIPSLEQEYPEEPHAEGEGSPTVPRAQLIGKTVSVAGGHDVTACYTGQPLLPVLPLAC